MPRDAWDKAETVAKIVSAILIPIALVLVGHYYDARERASTEQTLQAERTANRISSLLRSLSSDSARERSMALAVAEYYGRRGELPEELLPPIQEIALHDPNAEVAKAAGGALNATAKGQPSLASEITKTGVQDAARVYLHIASESQRDPANRLAAALASGGYAVPGIERVDVTPARTQVRFFHDEDKPRADDLAKRLRDANLKDVQVQRIAGYEDRAPQKQLEVWLSASESPK